MRSTDGEPSQVLLEFSLQQALCVPRHFLPALVLKYGLKSGSSSLSKSCPLYAAATGRAPPRPSLDEVRLKIMVILLPKSRVADTVSPNLGRKPCMSPRKCG